MFLTVVGVMLVCFSIFAFAKEVVYPALSEQAAKALEKKESLTPEQVNFKQRFALQEKAKKYGIDINGLTDEQVNELKSKRDAGVLIKELMNEYGVSKATVYRLLGDKEPA